MAPHPQYVPLGPEPAQPSTTAPRTGRSPVATAGIWAFALAAVLLLGLSGLITWRWLDANVLHWGVEEGTTTEVNSAELLERVRAFELATMKHTYDGNAHVEASKVLNAGPARVSLPSWVAGQQLDVKGKVTVTAGVDLSKVRPEDMQVTRTGKDTHVIITLPAPEILSAELVPDSLDMDTSQGFITRLGIGQKDMRDRAADYLVGVAKQSALEQGILDDAGRESERRLQTFLQGLPQSGDGRVTYTVVVRPANPGRRTRHRDDHASPARTIYSPWWGDRATPV